MDTDKGNSKNRNNHGVGNAGLFYCCYKLAQLGWNVLPTQRNAKGPDIVMYSPDGKTLKTIQVKTLSRPNNVQLGKHPTYDMSDFVMVCWLTGKSGLPEIFIMTPRDIRKLAGSSHGKTGESWWLVRKSYEVQFKDNWKLIGKAG